jgi:hypothetical protein
LLLTAVFRPLSWGTFDFLPAGPTPLIFAILAQYHAMVPHVYKYKVALTTGFPSGGNNSNNSSSSTTNDDDVPGVTLSDKSTKYLLALQLALFQWPGSLLGATVGWMVGQAWRSELLPGALTRWRVPGWLVGVRTPKSSSSERFEGMRRRLESEAGASATGAAPPGTQQPGAAAGEGNRRRTMGQQLLDEVRGAF